MVPRYDVIVIGGGHNGLVCAALVAARGRRVLLLERGEQLGGLAAGDEFHAGFTAVGPLHETSTLRPAVLDAIGIAGLERGSRPAPIFIPQLPGVGPGLLLEHDPVRASAEIAAHSKRDAANYGAYRDFLGRVTPVIRRLCEQEAPALFADSLASLLTLAGPGIALRRLGRESMMELLRIAPMCTADWLNEQFETEILSCSLALPAHEATFTGPWSPGTVANLLRAEALADGTVHGGPVAVIAALGHAACDAGVEIRTGARVESIRVEGGAVVGVTLAGGETIDAGSVAAACDPKHALLDLVPPSALPVTSQHRIESLRTSGTSVKVDIACRGDLRFACRPELSVTRARVVSTLDDMERAFDAIKYKAYSKQPVLDVFVPPGAAPDGESVLSIVAHYAPYELDGGWTDAARERLGDHVTAHLARHVPDLPDRLIARRVQTPADLEARYGVTGGHLHHVEHALDQLLVRPVPECAQHGTPITGLFLCGSGTHSGGGLTGLPGKLAAQAVLGRPTH